MRSDDETHGRDAGPDYRRVFNQTEVGRLDIRMDAANWQLVLGDIQNMAGPSGFGLNVGFSPEQLAACDGRVEANACTAGDPPVAGRCVQGGFFTGGRLVCPPLGIAGAGQDEVELLPRTPVYVPADISFQGETFRRVGFRLKGNSTLLLTWRRGSDKLPSRLNFDGLEARYPDTRDQPGSDLLDSVPFVIGATGEPFGRNLAGSAAQFDAAVNGPNGLLAYVNRRAVAVQQALRNAS